MIVEPQRPDWFEQVFVVFALFFFSGALLPLLRPDLDQVGGDPTAQAVWLLIYTLTALLLARRPRALWQALTKDWLMTAVVAIGLASVFWSFAPEITMRRTFGLFGTTLFTVYLASRFTLDDLMRLLTWAMGLALAGSLLMVAVAPGLGIESGTHAGSLRGLYGQKNVAGRVMAFSALLFGLRLWLGDRRSRLLWAGALGSLAFLLGTTSKTSLLSFLLLGAVLACARVLRSHASLILGLTCSAVLAFALAVWGFATNAEAITGALGRDVTLTGRIPIWEAVFGLLQSQNRLWQGYGYESFWLGEAGDSGYVWRAINYQAAFSHNGFLEVWLNVGLVGLGLLLLHMAWTGGLAAWRYRHAHDAAPLFYLLVLAFSLLFNLTEASLVKANNLFWVLYGAVALQLLAGGRDGAFGAPSRKVEPVSPV